MNSLSDIEMVSISRIMKKLNIILLFSIKFFQFFILLPQAMVIWFDHDFLLSKHFDLFLKSLHFICLLLTTFCGAFSILLPFSCFFVCIWVNFVIVDFTSLVFNFLHLVLVLLRDVIIIEIQSMFTNVMTKAIIFNIIRRNLRFGCSVNLVNVFFLLFRLTFVQSLRREIFKLW